MKCVNFDPFSEECRTCYSLEKKPDYCNTNTTDEVKCCDTCSWKGRMWYNQKNGMCIGCVDHDRWEAGKNGL